MPEALVIGREQSGLAAGYHLRRAGFRFAIIEAGATVGGASPRYYDSLRFFSPARYYALPAPLFPQGDCI